jgi:predicted nucleotidyltransferase
MTTMTKQRKGGLARSRSLTPARRRDIARKAAVARWSKIDPREVLRDAGVIGDICRRHKIRTLYAFGSILRDDFTKESDVDLMYVGKLGLVEYFEARADFKASLHREVDLVNKAVIEREANRIRQRHILATAELVHEERGINPARNGDLPARRIDTSSSPTRGERPSWRTSSSTAKAPSGQPRR